MAVDDIIDGEDNRVIDFDSFKTKHTARKPNNYLVRKAKVIKETVADKLRAYGVSFKFGWNTSWSKLHYLNSRRITADTISRRTGIEDVDKIEAGLELAVSNLLDVRVEQDFSQLRTRKKQFYDEIADFTANPGTPSLKTKKSFVYQNRYDLNTRTDIAYMIPFGCFLTSLVLLVVDINSSPPFSLGTFASIAGAKSLDAYLNSALNNKQYHEAIPSLQREGESGFRLFMEMYKNVEPKCAASQTHQYQS